MGAAAAVLCSCDGWFNFEKPSEDAALTGQTVSVPKMHSNESKLFVLNEGGLGHNNASLDFLRLSDGTYVTGAFKKMNPDVAAGLGDVGNDMAVNGEELWLVLNNSGIVEVISARDEKEIATIAIPNPRNIAFDGEYAYVTSWAGAYVNGNYDSGYYAITDYKNPKGQVYRIDLKTKEVKGSVQVGYQPEGIACYGGKLFVANSGGISSQLPPDYSYDNTLSIIDTGTFTVTDTVEVVVNMKNVYSDRAGNIYVTTLGNYFDIHSGVYMMNAAKPSEIKHISDYVTVSCMDGETFYAIGTESEFDWNETSHEYKAFSVNYGQKNVVNLDIESTPYSIAASGNELFFVGEIGIPADYFNPGRLSCYSNGTKLWSVGAGVLPGHIVFY